LLDSVRRRWVGKSLWTNVKQAYRLPPVFSNVRVLNIDPVKSYNGSYAFTILSDNGEKDTVHCQLQPPDTSFFSADIFSNSFGQLFLEHSPSEYWGTVPGSGFDRDGIVLGEDTAAFMKRMREIGIQTKVYIPALGKDSGIGVELKGKGVWGIPLDTSFAYFKDGKLNGIVFMMMNDSSDQIKVRNKLIESYGTPSVTLSSHGGMVLSIQENWLYYSPQQELSSITLTRSVYNTNMPQKVLSQLPSFPTLSMLTYSDVGKRVIP
jgi:hypothetical protein